jgi:hypothetical protein
MNLDVYALNDGRVADFDDAVPKHARSDFCVAHNESVLTAHIPPS